jgi:predicted secreted protein
MAALALAAGDPTPPAPATTPAPAAEKAQPKDSDRVCWMEQVTGSHRTTRVCSTRGELEQRQRQDQEFVNQHSRNAPSSFGH